MLSFFVEQNLWNWGAISLFLLVISGLIGITVTINMWFIKKQVAKINNESMLPEFKMILNRGYLVTGFRILAGLILFSILYALKFPKTSILMGNPGWFIGLGLGAIVGLQIFISMHKLVNKCPKCGRVYAYHKEEEFISDANMDGASGEKRERHTIKKCSDCGHMDDKVNAIKDYPTVINRFFGRCPNCGRFFVYHRVNQWRGAFEVPERGGENPSDRVFIKRESHDVWLCSRCEYIQRYIKHKYTIKCPECGHDRSCHMIGEYRDNNIIYEEEGKVTKRDPYGKWYYDTCKYKRYKDYDQHKVWKCTDCGHSHEDVNRITEYLGKRRDLRGRAKSVKW